MRWIQICCVMVLLAGCSPAQTQNQGNAKILSENECKETPVRHIDIEKKAKKSSEQVDGVDQAVVVCIDDEMDVALKVSNFNRLRLKHLRKEVFHRLKEEFPKTKVHVSTDSKIYKELEKLSNKPVTTDKKTACQMKKKLKKIEDQMRG